MTTRHAGWPLAIVVGLVGLAGCGTEETPTQTAPTTAAATTAPAVDPVLQPLAGVWEIDCGGNFVQFKLTVSKDTATFEWQTYKAPGSKETQIERMDLTLATVNGAAVATVTKADTADRVGKKLRLSTKDADSILAHGEADGVLDMDYTLYRESLGREVDCGGD